MFLICYNWCTIDLSLFMLFLFLRIFVDNLIISTGGNFNSVDLCERTSGSILLISLWIFKKKKWTFPKLQNFRSMKVRQKSLCPWIDWETFLLNDLITFSVKLLKNSIYPEMPLEPHHFTFNWKLSNVSFHRHLNIFCWWVNIRRYFWDSTFDHLIISIYSSVSWKFKRTMRISRDDSDSVQPSRLHFGVSFMIDSCCKTGQYSDRKSARIHQYELQTTLPQMTQRIEMIFLQTFMTSSMNQWSQKKMNYLHVLLIALR